MRIRQIKPEFWTDVKMHGLPLETRLIYIGLWNEADDSGWLRWEPRQLAMDLLPDVPEAEALAMLKYARTALTRRGRLKVYRCGHAEIPNLPKHQRLAALTKQVHTFEREHHKRCHPQATRRQPAGNPQGPREVRLGQVRLGKVTNRASAREEADGPSDFQRLVPWPNEETP